MAVIFAKFMGTMSLEHYHTCTPCLGRKTARVVNKTMSPEVLKSICHGVKINMQENISSWLSITHCQAKDI